jgi:hypothetical protein
MARLSQTARRVLVGGLWTIVLLTAAPATGDEQESWDAIYIGGKKVGFMHVWVTPLQEKGRDLVRVRVHWEFNIKRGDNLVSMLLEYGTIEKPDGSVLRLETRTVAAQNLMTTYGERRGDTMELTLEVGNQRQRQVIPWTDDIRGPYGAEMSLSREPMKPGQKRDIKIYIPELNKVCVTHLIARDHEPIRLGGGTTRKLLRVEAPVTTLEGEPQPAMNATHWVDASGQILKSTSEALGGTVIYRTTREAAEAPSLDRLDMIAQTIVKVARPIANPEQTGDIVYRITLRDDDPSQVFPSDRRQTIRKSSAAHTAILEVHKAGPNEGPAGPPQVDAVFLRPNTQIESDDPKVIELMRKAVGDRTDPWAKAVAIEHWVAENIKDKNFATTFATAAEVARDLTGDCTEHSVLTAAMCRAAGIPARVAVGLLYVPRLRGFGFHMWNEVYVNGRWVAVDAAFDQSEVDAVHIKLSDSSLDGVSPYEAFLSVMRVSNKLTIEPVEIR